MIEVRGVDPSLRATGVCLPDGSTYTIKTGQAVKGDHRLTILRKAFTYYVKAYPALLTVMEAPGRFKSGDAALATGMAQGIVREVLADVGEPVAFIPPTVLKQFATGRGTADKSEMVAAANAGRYWLAGAGRSNLLTDDNQADSWWLWQMGKWRLGCADVPEILDSDAAMLHQEGLRHRCVFGPWKNGGGAKWPGQGKR